MLKKVQPSNHDTTIKLVYLLRITNHSLKVLCDLQCCFVTEKNVKKDTTKQSWYNNKASILITNNKSEIYYHLPVLLFRDLPGGSVYE